VALFQAIVLDSKRPEDAKKQLRAELVEGTDGLEETAIVFVDETSLQERGNVVRVIG